MSIYSIYLNTIKKIYLNTIKKINTFGGMDDAFEYLTSEFEKNNSDELYKLIPLLNKEFSFPLEKYKDYFKNTNSKNKYLYQLCIQNIKKRHDSDDKIAFLKECKKSLDKNDFLDGFISLLMFDIIGAIHLENDSMIRNMKRIDDLNNKDIMDLLDNGDLSDDYISIICDVIPFFAMKNNFRGSEQYLQNIKKIMFERWTANNALYSEKVQILKWLIAIDNSDLTNSLLDNLAVDSENFSCFIDTAYACEKNETFNQILNQFIHSDIFKEIQSNPIHLKDSLMLLSCPGLDYELNPDLISNRCPLIFDFDITTCKKMKNIILKYPFLVAGVHFNYPLDYFIKTIKFDSIEEKDQFVINFIAYSQEYGDIENLVKSHLSKKSQNKVKSLIEVLCYGKEVNDEIMKELLKTLNIFEVDNLHIPEITFESKI